MQVFYSTKIVSVINRKEEITDETCLITEQEREKNPRNTRYSRAFFGV